MGRRYQASDFSDTKPRITLCRRQFGDRVYTYRCHDAASGSDGYGTTPKDAYNAWRRNFNRRATFYNDRQRQAEATLRRLNLHH